MSRKTLPLPKEISGSDQKPLGELMRVAVPLHMIALSEQNLSVAERFAQIQNEAASYGEECDNNPAFTEALVTKIPGQSAQSFNRTARIVALMSFLPGGIEIFGEKFESKIC